MDNQEKEKIFTKKNFAEKHCIITGVLRIFLLYTIFQYGLCDFLRFGFLIAILVSRYAYISKHDETRYNGKTLSVNLKMLIIFNIIGVVAFVFTPMTLFFSLFLFSGIYFVFFDTEFILPLILNNQKNTDE